MVRCHAPLIHLPHCHQSRFRQWQDRWRRLEPLLRRGERCDGRLSNVPMRTESLAGSHTVTQSVEQSTRSLAVNDAQRTCDERAWTPGSGISCALSAGGGSIHLN